MRGRENGAGIGIESNKIDSEPDTDCDAEVDETVALARSAVRGLKFPLCKGNCISRRPPKRGISNLRAQNEAPLPGGETLRFAKRTFHVGI